MLSPSKFSYDQRFEKEIQEIGSNIKGYNFMGDDVSEQPANIQTTIKSYGDYSKIAGPEALVPLLISERMLFTLFRGDRNFIALIDTVKPKGTADELKAIAERYDVQHIVYFPEVRLFYRGDTGVAIMRMNVYDRNTNTISLEYVNEEDWNGEEHENPEFRSGTDALTLFYNVTLSARIYILDDIAETNPAIQQRIKEARLKRDQEFGPDYREEDPDEEATYKQLIGEQLNKPFNKQKLNSFFKAEKVPFSPENIYQVLYNSDSTKLVAFTVDPKSGNREYLARTYVAGACEKYGIVKDRSFDSLYVGSIIRGIKSQGHWYFDQLVAEPELAKTKEESKKILLCHLTEWHFTGRQGGFWSDEEEGESWLFSLAVEPYYPVDPYPYRGMNAWDEFRPNRQSFNYITYVEANHILRNMEAFETKFTLDVLTPFYQKTGITKTPENPLLIYTPDREIVLHPFFKGTEGSLHPVYLVFDRKNGKVYEWIYFPEKTVDRGTDLLTAVKMDLNQITAFSLDKYLIIGDPKFREEYLFQQFDSGYKYLKAVE